MALPDDINDKKRALDAARPLPGEVVHALADWFERELTMAAARVERVGLTPAEIERVIEKGAVLRSRPIDDQRLVVNHVDALRVVARLSYQPRGVITERSILALHGVLFQGIDARAGTYRDGPPDDAEAVRPDAAAEPVPDPAPDPAKLRVSMSALSGWLRRTEPGPESAVEAHLRVMSVRPFARGNTAVALLLTNLLLNRAGYPPVVLDAGSRDAYRDALARARATGDKAAFRETMLGLLDRSLDVCLVAAARGVAQGVGGTPTGHRDHES
ncbi:Fic family protein [Azospirillum halopraeferens]|uniref:Fic family protein n=1 Tax=Azospirillum halopraeferens TaxID=34010 RepID=UPI0004051A77|nr:Fic family protein [Azospirillum halopraeferens]